MRRTSYATIARPSAATLALVEAAIRRRGSTAFAAREIGAEIGRCRQMVYAAIRVLNDRGHRIEGEPRMGFMARMLDRS